MLLAGKNDGSVKGVRYFRCRNHHGVFVRHDKLAHDKRRAAGRNTKVAKAPTNLRRSTGNLSLSAPRDGTASNAASPANISSSLMRPTAASSAKHKWRRSLLPKPAKLDTRGGSRHKFLGGLAPGSCRLSSTRIHNCATTRGQLALRNLYWWRNWGRGWEKTGAVAPPWPQPRTTPDHNIDAKLCCWFANAF